MSFQKNTALLDGALSPFKWVVGLAFLVIVFGNAKIHFLGALQESGQLYHAATFGYDAAILVLILVFIWIWKKSFSLSLLGLGRSKNQRVTWAIVILSILIIGYTVGYIVLPKYNDDLASSISEFTRGVIPRSSEVRAAGKSGDWERFWYLLVIFQSSPLIFGVLWEELFFCGIAMRTLQARFAKTWSVYLWVAVIFILYHNPPYFIAQGDLRSLAYYGGISLVACWLQIYTQSLYPCILFHFWNNYVVFLHSHARYFW